MDILEIGIMPEHKKKKMCLGFIGSIMVAENQHKSTQNSIIKPDRKVILNWDKYHKDKLICKDHITAKEVLAYLR